MGLCKCSKRRVTNLFCFVHRVNVCEDCMIAQHNKCVVHSYLKWLEDSDYDDFCVLCTDSIQQGQVVRLTCYDLLHQTCLESYIQRVPDVDLHCPRCKDSLIPDENIVSPVANQLRFTLKSMGVSSHIQHKEKENQDQQVSSASAFSLEELTTSDHSFQTSFPASRVPSFSPSEGHHGDVGIDYTDHDENKYQRKTMNEMFRKWIKSHIHPSQRVMDSDLRGIRRSLFFCALVAIAIVTVIVILTRVGREVARTDTALDWKLNPNLRTGD